MTQSTDEFFRSRFAEMPLMLIVRGIPFDETLRLAELAWSLGVKVMEIPYQSETDLQRLEALASFAEARGTSVGVGTITDPDSMRRAADAGASFAVSPGFDPEISLTAASLGLPYLPGVSSPTDVQLARKAGHTWLKCFPAESLGSQWIRHMHGPFPDAAFVATGGISSSNAASFLSDGASAVAMGSSVAREGELELVIKSLRTTSPRG